jgi:predicted ATPase/class 3 adenylate cyclase/DNA-binding XRE family transcriptional regulator
MPDSITPVRVFISSPGDLVPERHALRTLLEEFNHSPIFRDRVKLIPYAWEQGTPPVVGPAPQDTVDSYLLHPEDADIVVCMLWLRMGSPLERLDPTTNRPYQSGTEYEFLTAYRARQARGRPLILLYRCVRSPLHPAHVEREQLDRVEAFFQRFQTGGDLQGLTGSFDTLDSLRDKLRYDLSLLLQRDFAPPPITSTSQDTRFAGSLATMENTASFGYWLRRQRRALDLTQEALAQRVGCGVVSIGKFERDELRPTRQLAERLAECLAIGSEERAIFIKAARAVLSVDRVPLPFQPVDESLSVASTPTIEMAGQHGQASHALPAGTVTFLFADVADSRRLWQRYPLIIPHALTRYVSIVRDLIERHGGTIFRIGGEVLCAAFTSAVDAVTAALATQQALQAESWGESGPLHGRVALHTGNITPHDGDYAGLPVNRLRCMLEAGHSGQILISRATQELVRDELPPGVNLLDLGEHQLKDLIRPEHIFQLTAPDLPDDFPPLVTLDQVRTNLPMQPTPFTGREQEVAAVRALLSRGDVRLVTLTGPGGAGKSRLALQAAAELIEEFADGVYFVTLAPISDPALVVSTIAQTLDVKEASGQLPLASLKHFLRDKQLLLVLDNFEQVVAAAPLITELLAAAPGVKSFITSRSPLHVSGEREYPVPPLTVPKLPPVPPLGRLRQYEGVHLFIERAQAVKPDFIITSENAPAVAEICYRLDGLPLAIELAAARVKLLPPQALLTRLSSRLRLLTGGARDLPARQQTLRAAIAWSEDLLSTNERTLLARLAVFVGGCTLEAVEAICNADGSLDGDGLDELHALLNNSLLRQEEQAQGEPRFVMLETIREYALERLVERGEAEMLRQQHAAYYLLLAEAAVAKLQDANQDVWLAQLEAEHDNLRAALRRTLERQDAETALRLGAALWHFWEIHGHFAEGRRWLEAVLRQSQSTPTAVRAKAFSGAGTMAWQQGDYHNASLFHQEALALYRELGDQSGIAFALNNIGVQAHDQGDFEQAAVYYTEGLDLARASRDRQTVAYILHNLGEIAQYQRDYARALELYNASLAVSRELGNRWMIAYTQTALARVTHYQGDDDHATALFRESLMLLQAVGGKEGIAECLEAWAGLRGGQGHAPHAVRLYGAAAALRAAIGAPLSHAAQTDYERDLATIRGQLAETVFAEAWADGQAMPLEQVIAEALDYSAAEEH